MTLALFYDTETTGLPLWHDPSDDPRQPHLVQLGGSLVDLATRRIISSIDVIIQPNGWIVPDEVAEIHGITTEYAERFGMPESQAVDLLMRMWGMADCRIGHNETFDARILRIAIMRQGERWSQDLADYWKAASAECTAKLATPIMQLPPTAKMRAARRFHHKTPTLSEAVLHFTGKAHEDAHSAMADVQGCMSVYFAIQELDRQPAAAAA